MEEGFTENENASAAAMEVYTCSVWVSDESPMHVLMKMCESMSHGVMSHHHPPHLGKQNATTVSKTKGKRERKAKRWEGGVTGRHGNAAWVAGMEPRTNVPPDVMPAIVEKGVREKGGPGIVHAAVCTNK